jgi:hypothetical protein
VLEGNVIPGVAIVLLAIVYLHLVSVSRQHGGI